MSLKNMSAAWLITWGLSDFLVMFIAPNINLDTPTWSFGVVGILTIAVAVSALAFKYDNPIVKPGLIIGLLIVVFLQAFSSISSFSGTSLWNVPFANTEVFQVSMAFLEEITAAAAMLLSIEVWKS